MEEGRQQDNKAEIAVVWPGIREYGQSKNLKEQERYRFFLEAPEGTRPVNTLILAIYNSFQASDMQNYKFGFIRHQGAISWLL